MTSAAPRTQLKHVTTCPRSSQMKPLPCPPLSRVTSSELKLPAARAALMLTTDAAVARNSACTAASCAASSAAPCSSTTVWCGGWCGACGCGCGADPPPACGPS